MHNESQDVSQELIGIVTKTLWAAFTGIAIGLGMGILNQARLVWLPIPISSRLFCILNTVSRFGLYIHSDHLQLA